MYRPTSPWSWAFLIIAACQAAIGLALEGYVFAAFQLALRPGAEATTQSRTVPTYASLFIFGFLYQLLLVYDALFNKNTIQLIGLCLYNLGLLIYAAVQIDQIHDAVAFLLSPPDIKPTLWPDVEPFLITVPCVIALGTILLSLTAWKLYQEFAWSIYKHISADLKLKRCYLAYQIYIALLKFDAFFFLSFTVQFLVVVTNTSDVEFWLTIAALPITIALLFLAAYWTRRESVFGMLVTIALYFAALAYFLFKLVRMYDMADLQRVRDYQPARRGLTTFAVITVLLLVLTIVNAGWCTANFGKGLKPHIQKRKVPSPEDKAFEHAGNTAYHGGMPLGQVTSRMTID